MLARGQTPSEALPLREVEGGVAFAVRLQPGAKHTGVIGLHGESLKIAVAAPAEDGRANEALVEMLAGRLHVPRLSIAIISGHSSRSKVVRISGVSSSAVLDAFAPAAC